MFLVLAESHKLKHRLLPSKASAGSWRNCFCLAGNTIYTEVGDKRCHARENKDRNNILREISKIIVKVNTKASTWRLQAGVEHNDSASDLSERELRAGGRHLCHRNCSGEHCVGADGLAKFRAYLIFVTDTTDGVCVKKSCPV